MEENEDSRLDLDPDVGGGGGRGGFAASGGGRADREDIRFSVSNFPDNDSRSAIRPETKDLTFRRSPAVNSVSSV